jgi:diguanylate cyclase (GGDEF)-like protein
MAKPFHGPAVRARLIAIVILVLLAGFGVTNVISYRVSKETVRASLIENELPLTSDNIYSEIQADLLRPIFVSSLMASDTFVQDWLVSGEKEPERAIRYLAAIQGKYGVFTSFLVSEKSRAYYHFTGVSQTVSESDPKDAWYFRVREMTAPYEINLDANPEQGGVLTIFINHRVVDADGNFLGATGVGLKVDAVAEVVGRYEQRYGRSVYFIDRNADIAVRSEGAAVTETSLIGAVGLAAVAEAIMTVESGSYEYQRGGEAWLATVRYIPELDWRVMVEQRESAALGGIRRSVLTNLAVDAGVIGLTILILIYTVNLFQRRLEEMATTDKLTGLANRQLFDAALAMAVARKKRDKAPLSLILFDIDHFKKVNDTFGHMVGDRVIRAVADAARRGLRSSDLLCRWGGEEFIALLYDCAEEEALRLAESLRVALSETPDARGATASFGVTGYREGESVDLLLARADDALYRAKEEGRNRVVVES